jgi:hypothetical protein
MFSPAAGYALALKRNTIAYSLMALAFRARAACNNGTKRR